MKSVLFSLMIFFSIFGFSAEKDSLQKKDTNFWHFKSLFGTNGTQSSFVNWSAGGRNNISLLGFIDASLLYQKKQIKWSNDLKFAIGGLKFIDSVGKSQGMQKTDDRIDFASSFGYEFKKNWFYTFVGGFRTQSLDGFVSPNDSVIVSTFMAPGYLSFALGIEFNTKESNIFISPLAAKITFVKNQTLANAGAFGVEKAERDNLGNIIKLGQTQRNEIGSYLKFRFNKEIMKNIELKSRIEFFSNYLNNPQNIDVNAEIIFNFKVNKWFSSSLHWNLLYDDDIDVKDIRGNIGPRTQFKSVLGIGISYVLKNDK
jgi:hypothetical protein